MATKKKVTVKKTEHIAIRSEKIGSKKDGTPKLIINKDDKLLLTKEQVDGYRLAKIIK